MSEFTKQEFVSWLLTRDRHERFEYLSTSDCCLARFLRETGRASRPYVWGNSWMDQARSDDTTYAIPDWLQFSIVAQTMGEVIDNLSIGELEVA